MPKTAAKFNGFAGVFDAAARGFAPCGRGFSTLSQIYLISREDVNGLAGPRA
ncbi:hypothetical protein ACMA5I_12445 [Paracoccaceae bacterium GXU_MW_L88]